MYVHVFSSSLLLVIANHYNKPQAYYINYSGMLINHKIRNASKSLCQSNTCSYFWHM